MARQSAKSPSPLSTRRALLNLLKQDGPQDAQALARQLGLTAMAVRQHLYELEREKLAAFDVQPRPRGRPAKLWRLTPEADRYFPDRHADLAAELISELEIAFGAGGLETLLKVRIRRQIENYRRRIPRRASLSRRLNALADIRTEEGYMADVVTQSDGSFLLVENHCPICLAAQACNGLCAAELTVFQAVLGEGVHIERTEHIVAGARRCVYRIAQLR